MVEPPETKLLEPYTVLRAEFAFVPSGSKRGLGPLHLPLILSRTDQKTIWGGVRFFWLTRSSPQSGPNPARGASPPSTGSTAQCPGPAQPRELDSTGAPDFT